jgi:hypothetical protein
VRHYARHRSHLLNRLSFRSDALRNVGALGIARWRDLEEILRDCARSNTLTPLERTIAAHAVEWVADEPR